MRRAVRCAAVGRVRERQNDVTESGGGGFRAFIVDFCEDVDCVDYYQGRTNALARTRGDDVWFLRRRNESIKRLNRASNE